MHRTASFRRHRRAPSRGVVAVIPLALAVFFGMALMTACHSTPPQLAKAPGATPASDGAPVRVAVAAEPVPLSSMFFDEHFYTPPASGGDDSDGDASPD